MVTLQGIKTCHLAEWTGQESGAQGNGGHCTICLHLICKNEQYSTLHSDTIMYNVLYYDKDI